MGRSRSVGMGRLSGVRGGIVGIASAGASTRTMRMLRPEGYLAFMLRLEAVVLLCAIPPALMPTEWMASAHAWLGMGTMPRGPLVEYLTRSLSLLYASWVPILWLAA